MPHLGGGAPEAGTAFSPPAPQRATGQQPANRAAHPPQPPIAAHGCRRPSRRGPEGGLFPRGGEGGRAQRDHGLPPPQAGRKPPHASSPRQNRRLLTCAVAEDAGPCGERGSPSLSPAQHPLRARPGHRLTLSRASPSSAPSRPQPHPGMRRSAYARRAPSAPHVPGGQAQGGNRDANGAEPLARLLLSSQIS